MSDLRIQLESLKDLLNSMNKGSTFGQTVLSPYTPTDTLHASVIQSSTGKGESDMSEAGHNSSLHIYSLARLVEEQGEREPFFPSGDGDIESYRMSTEYFKGYVVHEGQLLAGFRRKSTWDLKGEIGRGSAGGVYLQQERERDFESC